MADRASDVNAKILDSNGNPVDNFGSLVKVDYDYVSVAYPTAIQEVYAHKTGGAIGTTVATVTVDYVDSTKVDLSAITVT